MKVLYHASCFDGFCAAWLIHVAHRNRQEQIEYIPVQYGNWNTTLGGQYLIKQDKEGVIEQTIDIKNQKIVIVDFSFKHPVMQQLIKHTGSLVCLDHHKTAKADLEGLHDPENNVIIHFDMEKSGARITNEFYQSTNNAFMSDSHWLVDYTEDRDLWWWKLPNSRDVSAGLQLYPFDFDTWDSIANDFNKILFEGQTINRYLKLKVEQIINHARRITLRPPNHGKEYEVLTVNCTNPDIHSDVAGSLAEGELFGSCYFHNANGFTFSLRSRGDFDVSEIAAKYGGGGHKNAAGFTVSELEASSTNKNNNQLAIDFDDIV